jgi:Uma2 family endonuclease
MEQADDLKHIEHYVPMTYADYQQRYQGNTFVEWVNDEAIIFTPPTARHQEFLSFFATLIDSFLTVYPIGEVISGPFKMKLSPTGSVRTPDVLFVAKQNRRYIDEWRLNGAADLVVEIIDEASIGRDRGDKFYEYQANGVREYWIIDPRPGFTRVDLWTLDENECYQPIPIGSDGSYPSTVLPNFKLNVNHLFNDNLPAPLELLADMIGVDEILRAINHKE